MDIIQLNLFDCHPEQGRTCSKCKTYYPSAKDSFQASKTVKSGFQSNCKTCRQSVAKKYYQQESVKQRNHERHISNREQKKVYDKIYNQLNKEKRRDQKKIYSDARRDYYNQKRREWSAKNPERRREIANAYVERNREKVYQSIRDYHKAHPEKAIARKAVRRALEKNACPSWSNLAACREFYKVAKLLRQITGENYHVDHIDPLNSKLVCGLHVPANLRIIKARDNYKKNNKFTPYGFDTSYYLPD